MRGIDISMSSKIGDLLYWAGLKKVYSTKLEIPLGGKAGGRLGANMAQDYLTAVSGMRAAVVPKIADDATFSYMLDEARREIDNYTAICPFYFAYGYKP